jgi:DUF1680 family protein
VVRTLASLTGYFYAVRDDSLFVNLYGQSVGEATVQGAKVKLTQTTEYPWRGSVRIAVAPERPARFTLRVRIPVWAQGRPVASDLYEYEDMGPALWSARVGGRAVEGALERGFLAITREWRAGDEVELNFGLPVRRVRGHAKIAATAGRVAFERGPIVYCVEELEGRFVPGDLSVSPAVQAVEQWRADLLGGVVALELRDGERTTTAIPYFAWNNRGLAPMAVWLKRAP